MKCFVLVLAFVALAQSLSSGQRNIQITEDGIVITGANGRQITINRPNAWSGQRNIDISVSGPNVPTRRIQINDQNEVIDQNNLINTFGEDTVRSKRSRTSDYKPSTDVLSEILREYQGVVSEEGYQTLLRRVEKAVQQGQISQGVLDILRGFEQNEYLSQIRGQQGQLLGQQGGLIGQQGGLIGQQGGLIGQQGGLAGQQGGLVGQQGGLVGLLGGRQQSQLQQQVPEYLVQRILQQQQVQQQQQDILAEGLLQLLEQNVQQQWSNQGLGQGRVGLTRQITPGTEQQIYGISQGQRVLGGLGPLSQSGIAGRLYWNNLPLYQQAGLRQGLTGILGQQGYGNQQLSGVQGGISGQDRLVRDILIEQQLEQQQQQLINGLRQQQQLQQGTPSGVWGQEGLQQQYGINQYPQQYDQGRTIAPLWRRVLLGGLDSRQQQLGVYPQGYGGYVRYGSGQGYEQLRI